jgi:hypothetical protein
VATSVEVEAASREEATSYALTRMPVPDGDFVPFSLHVSSVYDMGDRVKQAQPNQASLRRVK